MNGIWGHIVGLDVGHTRINCIITSLDPKIIHRESVPRPTGHMEAALTEAIKLLETTIANSKVDRAMIKGIGVGICGVIDKNAGTVHDTDTTRGRADFEGRGGGTVYFRYTESFESIMAFPIGDVIYVTSSRPRNRSVSGSSVSKPSTLDESMPNSSAWKVDRIAQSTA